MRNIFFLFLLFFCVFPAFLSGAEQEMLGLNREYWLNQKKFVTLDELIRLKVPPSGRDLVPDGLAAPWDRDYTERRNLGDYYFQRIFGWVVPDKTGDYIFYVGADDRASLYLSPDENPAHKQLIAEARGTGWMDLMRHPLQQSRRIRLEKNRRYYIEVRHYESAWTDWCGIGWKMPGQRISIILEENLRSR